MKHIDAERLRAEIKRRKEEYKEDRYMSDYRGQIAYYKDEIYDDLLSFIDSLQQEQQEKKEVKFVFPKFLYARTTNNKTIDVSYAPQSLDAIEYIRSDSLQQEQPEVDLEEEIDKVIADYSFTKTIDSGGFKTTVLDYAKIARHFFELGLWA